MLSESAGAAQRNSTWMARLVGWRVGEIAPGGLRGAAAAAHLAGLLLRPPKPAMTAK